MRYLLLKCKECSEEVEVACDGDGPLFCPECRSVDELEEIEPDLDPYPQRLYPDCDLN